MNALASKNRLREFLPANLTDFDTLFNQVFGPHGFNPVRALGAPAGLWEETDAYHIEMDVPGVTREDVDITLNKSTLQIVAERKQPALSEAENQRKGWHDERAYGKVTRSFTLPEAIDPDSIEAELNNGVLHVSVAKTPEAQPRRIEIK